MKPPHFIAAIAVFWSVATSSVSAQPVLDRVEQLLRRQLELPGGAAAAREPGYLGLVADDRDQQGRGVLVLSVSPDGPAARAGIEKGDLITAVDGRAVRSMDDMISTMTARGPGATVTITAERAGAPTERRVTLGRRSAQLGASEGLPAPSDSSRPRLGIRTVDVTEMVERENKLPDTSGATVIAITPGLPADQAGIPLGAVIRAVDGVAVRNPQELAAAVAASKGDSIELTYIFAATESKVRVNLASSKASPPELRARPVRPPAPTPGADELPPPAVENERLNALEARIREIEARIEKLEAASRAKEKP